MVMSAEKKGSGLLPEIGSRTNFNAAMAKGFEREEEKIEAGAKILSS